MKKAARNLLSLTLPAAGLLYIVLGASPALAIGGNAYTMASEPDESFLCSPDWSNCFTGGLGQVEIPLGVGAGLGGGTIESVTISKQEDSPYSGVPWIIQITCYTDSSYTTTCPDWVQKNEWNGFRNYFITEAATSSTDGKHSTAYFTNPSHEANANLSYPVTFRPEYYYKLIINDNGYNIGAYGSQALGVPYYILRGVKTKPDPVVIIPGILGSWEKNGKWLLDPILHTYDNLIDTFVANGYVEGQTIFRFPYDWKQSNSITAVQLKNKIAGIKAVCGCSKVDLVGHSMGGLVAATYIESINYQHDVDQLFLVATPLSGSPKAYKAWEGGEMDFSGGAANWFLNTHFKNEARHAGYKTVFEYIRGKPVNSIQELLPVNHNYLSVSISSTLVFPNGYPYNFFLVDLINKFDTIHTSGVTVKTILADTKNMSTIGGFIVASSTKPGLWEHGQPGATIFNDGDNTVPRWSIESVSPIDKEFDYVDHTGVASTSTPYLFKEMTDSDPQVIIGKVYDPVLSLLSFEVLSPIDIQITAPDGRKLGKDFASNTEISEIPDAFYSGFETDTEYAVILNPLPGQYKVETIGTGNGGSYTIVADYGDAATTTSVEVVGTSTPGTVVPYTFIVSATSTSISLPLPPIATSTPTTSLITPDTCTRDITAAYQNKWISKRVVYEKLVFDCKAIAELLKARQVAKTQIAKNLINTALKLTLADIDLLAKDKSNTKDAVLLIGKITLWFRSHLPYL